MTELTIEIAAIVGAAAGGTMGLLMSWAAGMYGRRPYSSAAIVFRATADDAAKVRSKFIDPLVEKPWPEPMTVEDLAGRSWTLRPTGRVVDAYGRTIGYIPHSQGDTPNPPPEVP